MTDYGHDLKFGSFITPVAAQADAVVSLAVASEAAGLDLVTFQDHPYQSNFLDTWTLLSFVAARTERVSLAGNVLNLPLRNPAVLARAVASLDLLSHGRAELGLGAGAFWDGIAAMGGTKLTPGQGVDALDEAIDIIRGIWAAGEPGGVRVEGQYHAAHGARRGPLPAHPTQIWLGAYKPRMLKLTGSKADGWLPSMSYLKDGDIPAANAQIDAAAQEAGRDPREIRRLLNIGGPLGDATEVATMVEQLVALATEHGFGTFILPADQASLIDAFGREVTPRVRDRVAAARQKAGTTTGAVRSARAQALRREGIKYDALPDSLAARAIEPGDHTFSQHRSTYIHSGNPGLILRPESAQEVADAVRYAADHSVKLGVRSGGHGISGRSTNDGGLVIDVGKLNRVELLDATTGRFRAGPGARWGEVAAALAPHGLGMSSGDYGDVGVGGLATAGGIGWFSRRHGLTIDHVVAADMVLADGRQLRLDRDENPDLFWAMRGAGGNFGVVTSFELTAYPVGNVVFARITYDLSDAASVLPAWAEVVATSPREVTSFLTMGPARQGNPAFGQASVVIASDDPSVAEPMLQPFLRVGPVLNSQAFILPYSALVESHFEGHDGSGGMTSHNGFVTDLTPDLARAMQDILRGNATQMMQLRAVGGAVNDISADAMAYAHRHQNFNLSAVGYGATAKRLETLWPEVDRYLEGLYISFETGNSRALLEKAFPGKTLERLQTLKAEYDPGELFDQNFPILPASRQARTA